jgi:hypothetical protein
MSGKLSSSAGQKLSKLGASKGGQARNRNLSPQRRQEIARMGALAKLEKAGGKLPLLAKYGADDRPLRIGSIEIPCYVLADGTRVLSLRGLQGGIGMSAGGGKSGARKIVTLMERLHEKDINIRNLSARANSPIRFIPPHGGIADGYEATILPDICAVLIEAHQRGVLDVRLTRMAERAAILQHGFATVGIVALVDEATGYQDARPRDALAKILEKFVAKELRPWIKTFPSDYYKQIYRLNGWPPYEEGMGSPGVVGHWTNNIVYKRLAPGVLEELQRQTPRGSTGRLKHRLFQRLTEDIGHPKLREHLTGVVMIMKYSPDWRTFMTRLDTEYPQWGNTLMLPFPDDYSPPDTGPVDLNDFSNVEQEKDPR